MNILALFAHPDDVELACAGTLLKYKKQGHKIFIGLVTSGDQGSKEYDSREEIGAIREKEQLSAAKYYDAEVRFCRFHDQRLFDTEEVRIAVLDIIRCANPDVIFTHYPGDPSCDHRITGQMVADLLLSLASTLLPANEPPISKTPSLFFADYYSPDFIPEVFVDITDEMDDKLAALSNHVSQIAWMKRVESLEGSDITKTPLVINAYRGLLVGCKYAEAFSAHRIQGYMPDFKLLP